MAMAAALAVTPAGAGGLLGLFGGGQSSVPTDDGSRNHSRQGEMTPCAKRRPAPGTSGALRWQREGSDEDGYIRNLHQNTGGTLLRGRYSSRISCRRCCRALTLSRSPTSTAEATSCSCARDQPVHQSARRRGAERR